MTRLRKLQVHYEGLAACITALAKLVSAIALLVLSITAPGPLIVLAKILGVSTGTFP